MNGGMPPPGAGPVTPVIADAKTPARLALARDCLEQGNYPAADILCRLILDDAPRCAAAWSLLGAVAMRLRAFEHARGYYRTALDCGAADAARGLDQATDAAGRPRPIDAPRYLLIKSWAAGFWSDVSHVLGGLLLAEMTGRVPVVHWGPNCLFGDGSGRDAFTFFFRPIGTTTVHDLMTLAGPTSFFPGKWNAANLLAEDNAKWTGADSLMGGVHFLNRPETVAVADFHLSVAALAPWIAGTDPLAGLSLEALHRYLIDKYLHPVEAIVSAAGAFVAEHFGSNRFVAAHIRGADKILEFARLPAATEAVLRYLDAVPPQLRLFVMTDDQAVATRVRARYGARVALSDSRRSDGAQGVHLAPAADGRRLGMEVMLDVYVALRSLAFVGIGSSNPSSMIALMKPWPNTSCKLIGRSRMLRRSAVLLLPRQFADLAH